MSLSAYYIPLQAQTGQRFKQIDYTYDLISGKVNEVCYQAGQPDAFYHNYEYDADNRIIKVYTSKDKINWDQDASYTYYAHGPLARVELGDNKVQGLDYAYTLQGWIKGGNSNLLKAENDMGNDGLSGAVHNRVAKDAFGYTLNYYSNDYTPIDATKWSNTAQRFEALTPNSDLLAARFDLYNSNISSMVTTIVEPKVYTGAANEVPNILPQGTVYKYDQLNRLLEMKAFQNLDVAANKWKQGSTYAGLYQNVFKYDANGNILYQERAGQNGLAFDKLTYQYKTDAGGQRRLQNRLYHVNDGNTNTALATDDIEDQGNFTSSPNINGVNNYRYDEIGNLKHDAQEGIDKIEWTVYGKIKSITRTTVCLRSDLEFQYDASGNRIAKIEKPWDANGGKPASEWIATYYARDAQGNVMGIYIHRPLTVGASFKVMERNLFGSSRLGSDYTEMELINALPVANPFVRVLGNKHFEGSNHLGNVLAEVSDRKIPRDDDGDGVTDYFQSEVLSAQDYSSFGVVLDARGFGVGGRYGFNGKEMDDEVKGFGNFQDYGMRVYDGRLGRFLSVDPIHKDFSWYSTYHFAGNTPIQAIDLDGREPDGVVDKQGKLTQPVIYLFNAILGIDKAYMQAVTITKNAQPKNNAETHSATDVRTNPSGETNYSKKTTPWLKTLAHEMKHVEQRNKASNWLVEFEGFLNKIFYGYHSPNNKIEEPARQASKRMERFLATYDVSSILESKMSDKLKTTKIGIMTESFLLHEDIKNKEFWSKHLKTAGDDKATKYFQSQIDVYDKKINQHKANIETLKLTEKELETNK